MTVKGTLAALVLLVATAGSAAAQDTCGELPKTWEGQAYAVSGDTLEGVGLKPRIGLWGIRAPDMPSNPGMRARAALEDMLASGERKLSCRMTGWGAGCRALAECTITAEWPAGSKAQPHDIAVRLLEDGFAYGSGLGTPPDWDRDASERIAHFEAIARRARKGLWLDWLGEGPKP